MENKSYITIDKSEWSKGEWQDEPDKMQFVDEATGYSCLIVRNSLGCLCGYVGIMRDHSLYGVDYNDDKFNNIDVHGGLTFSDKCNQHDCESKGICHVVEDGEDDNVWWLGFDCAHCKDYCPYQIFKYDKIIPENYMYRNIHYVKNEIKNLARQLSEMNTNVLMTSEEINK